MERAWVVYTSLSQEAATDHYKLNGWHRYLVNSDYSNFNSLMELLRCDHYMFLVVEILFRFFISLLIVHL